MWLALSFWFRSSFLSLFFVGLISQTPNFSIYSWVRRPSHAIEFFNKQSMSSRFSLTFQRLKSHCAANRMTTRGRKKCIAWHAFNEACHAFNSGCWTKINLYCILCKVRDTALISIQATRDKIKKIYRIFIFLFFIKFLFLIILY